MDILNDFNEFERKNFLTTHERHVATMGSEEQYRHLLANITKVKRNREKQCFEVYYKHGEWYHYTLNNEWY